MSGKGALRITAAVLAALVAWSVAAHPWGWLYGLGVHPYPAGSATPWTYQMWSGVIPAMTVLSLFASLGGAYHLHNCHHRRCWRLGKIKAGGVPWCSRHWLHEGHARVMPSKWASDSERLEQIITLLEQLTPRGEG